MTFQKCGGWTVALVAAMVLGGLGAVPSRAAGRAAAVAETAAGPTFGSVDRQRCAQDATLRKDSEAQWKDYAQSLDKTLQKLANGSAKFLNDKEIHELADLYQKPQPNATEQKRITELETKADAAGGEMSRLQQVASPGDADKKRFSDLTDAQQKGDLSLQTVQEDFKNRVSQRRDDLLQKLENQIRDAVAKVAKDKGLAVVFDAQVALYTQNDITAEVTKVLNSNNK